MSIDQCPMHVKPEQVREFDFQRDPVKLGIDPLDWLVGEFRGKEPFWSPAYGGFWVLTDPAQIREAYGTPALFSSINVGLGYTPFPVTLKPIQIDPPDHAKYRRLLAPWFSPRSADALEDNIRAEAIRLIDEIVDLEECDVIDLVAGKLPQHIFVTNILHLPVEDVPMFLRWEHDLMRHPKEPEQAQAAGAGVISYLRKTVEERRVNPLDNDLLSTLAQSEVDGELIPQQDLLGIVMLLFLAGLDTVTAALGWEFHFLATNPDHRRQIVESPELIPTAVEELLRFFTNVYPVRTVAEDIEFYGVKMAKGDRVLPLAVLAGRDDAEYQDADSVDFTRSSNSHGAFGLGPHRCLGSHLARKELNIVLEEFHKRIPDYELTEDKIQYHSGGVVGMDAVTIRWGSKMNGAGR